MYFTQHLWIVYGLQCLTKSPVPKQPWARRLCLVLYHRLWQPELPIFKRACTPKLRFRLCNQSSRRDRILGKFFLQLEVTGDRRPTWKQQLLTSISTSGNDTDWEQLHVIAQALQAIIQITDVQNHQTQNIKPNRPISLDPALIIQIAYRRHNAIFAYVSEFRPLAPLHGHYWAIVTLRRRSPRSRRGQVRLSDFMQSDLSCCRSRASRSLRGVI
jgi:hypothetical protein